MVTVATQGHSDSLLKRKNKSCESFASRELNPCHTALRFVHTAWKRKRKHLPFKIFLKMDNTSPFCEALINLQHLLTFWLLIWQLIPFPTLFFQVEVMCRYGIWIQAFYLFLLSVIGNWARGTDFSCGLSVTFTKKEFCGCRRVCGARAENWKSPICTQT